MPLSRAATTMMALVGFAGCARCASIQDYVHKSDYRLPYADRLSLECGAPIIILGRVLEANDIGRPRPSVGDPRVKVQLTRITVDVEQAIKGTVGESPLKFYYFTFFLAKQKESGCSLLPADSRSAAHILLEAVRRYVPIGGRPHRLHSQSNDRNASERLLSRQDSGVLHCRDFANTRRRPRPYVFSDLLERGPLCGRHPVLPGYRPEPDAAT